MKKLAVLIFILPGILYSQNIRYGISGSYNYNTTTTKTQNFNMTGRDVRFKSEPSMNLEAVVIYGFSEFFALNTSLGYSGKVVSTEWSGPADGPVHAILHFDYLSLSPKAEINPFYGLYINAGPCFDLLVNTTLEQEGDYVSDLDEIRDSKTFRMGLHFTAGYRINILEKLNIAPEIGYDLALTETHTLYGGKYSSARAGIAILF